MYSCGSDKEPAPAESPKIEITSAGNEQAIADAGGTTVVYFTATAPWSAQADQTWCQISPASGEAGAATINITVEPNTGYDERNAAITIQCGTAKQTITVTQKQKDAIILTASKVEMNMQGGEFSIELQANVTVEYEIEEAAKSWITPASQTKGLSTSTLRFFAAENTEMEKRQGSITLHNGALSEVVTIYQDGAKPTIVLTQNEYTVPSSGEEILVELKSNVDYEIQMPDANWITETLTKSMSSYTHRFAIAPNEGYDNRNASILFVNKENGLSESVSVTQLQKDAIIVAQNEYAISKNADKLTFNVNTNVELEVETSVDWITQIVTRGLTSQSLTFSIAENTGDQQREGVITISSGELTQSIKVLQAGKVSDDPEERKILIALYRNNGGENWNARENWCTDSPLSTWQGVTTDENGKVIKLELVGYNISGNVDLSGLQYLNYLALNENKGLQTLNVANCTSLDYLTCNYTQLATIDCHGCSNLRFFDCHISKVSSIDFTGCSNLESVNVDENLLSELDLSAATNLKRFRCYENFFKSLDFLYHCPELVSLICFDNQISALDLTKFRKLQTLQCHDNQIAELNFSLCNDFRYLECYRNQLTKLDLSYCPRLDEIVCGYSPLEEVTLPNNTEASIISYGWGAWAPSLYEEPTHSDGYQYPVFIYK